MRTGGPAATRAALATVHYLLSSEQTQCTALNVVLRRIDRTVMLHSGLSTGASLSGRITGGAFTLYASTGGRLGHQARKSPAGVGIGVSNLTLASAGAVIRLVMSSGDAELSAADVAMAAIAGINTRIADGTLWRDLIRADQDCRLPENTVDSLAFNDLFRDIERFISNEQRQAG